MNIVESLKRLSTNDSTSIDDFLAEAFYAANSGKTEVELYSVSKELMDWIAETGGFVVRQSNGPYMTLYNEEKKDYDEYYTCIISWA